MSPWKRNAMVVVSAIAVWVGPNAMARAEVDTRSTLALTYREGSGSEVDMSGTGAAG